MTVSLLALEVILSHNNTDFDGVAAMLAAARLYPGARPVVAGSLNANVRQFVSRFESQLPFVKPRHLPKGVPLHRVILVDTQRLSEVDNFRERIGDTRPDPPPVLILDHHPPDATLPPHVTFDGGNVAATTTLLVPRLQAASVSLTPVEATLLLLGIYEDTGTLTYLNTTPADVRAAAWLLEQGADLALLNEYLEHPLSARQSRLLDQLAQAAQVETIANHPVVIAPTRAPEYVEEISALAHRLRERFEADAIFLLVQVDGQVQAVARSLTPAIDVGAILSRLGGGGHAQAAAGLLRGYDANSARDALLRVLRTATTPVVAADLMARRPRTIPPDLPIATAFDLLRRYGHEGLPVVDANERLVGFLTRRDADKVARHGLGDRPASAFMTVDLPTVAPDASLTEVQQVMTDHPVSQVPVVDGGRLVGVITRTDLLRHLAQPAGQPPGRNLESLMAKAIPPALLNLIYRASDLAMELGFRLYLVGGSVRDLILAVPNFDLDLVVEGDAITLTQHLAVRYGGRATSHERFGTAKWILGENNATPGHKEQPLLSGLTTPLALDFVTARTEFYETPSALPTVEAGSLRQDLYRRDFTINTMAIRLEPDHRGELIDFYGGQRDLEQGLIRVLHSLSFVEDPTRILRAIRLEQRLGFRLEERTETLLRTALELLPKVSGDRLRHELYLILQEAAPERTLRRLRELHILDYLQENVTVDDWLAERFRLARESWPAWEKRGLERAAGKDAVSAGKFRSYHRDKGRRPSLSAETPPPPLTPIYIALLCYRLDEATRRGLLNRFNLLGETSRLVEQVVAGRRLLPALSAPQLPASRIYHLLHRQPEEVLFTLWLAGEAAPDQIDPTRFRPRIEFYLDALRHVRPALNGTDLQALGLRPGPVYTRLLTALLDARLDGQVQSREDELALVQRLLAQ